MNKQEGRFLQQGGPIVGGTLVLVAVLVGVAVYAIDAAIWAFLYQQGSLIDQLIHPATTVLLARLCVAGIFLALGITAYRLWRRERISAEQARTAESFLRSVVDNIPNAVFIKDARELRFVRMNPAGERLFGFTEQELTGKNDYDFFPPAQADFFTRKDRNVLESGLELDIPEEEIDTKRMGRRILHTKKVPILDNTGQPAFLLGVAEDITERRQAEADIMIEKARAEMEAQRHHLELAHVMRLSTLGEMASGMAHELNQPLTAAIAYCGAAVAMVEQQSSPPEEITDILKKVMEQTQRAGDIIWRLQALVRKGSTHKASLDMDDLIRGVISFVEWEINNSRVTVDLHLHGEGTSVTADGVQIEQVLINLVRNSLDSIKDGGVTDGRIQMETRITQQETLRATVSDNGPGIAPSILERLFEPFQTTKKNGIGIGLSISHSIIEAHGGKMWGESSLDGGATFGLELPLAVETADPGTDI